MSLVGDVLGDAQLAPWMELLPVLALLPYGASLCEDRAQKYHQAIILRSGYRKYIAVKAIVACTVSGCVLALGETLFLMILLLLRSALPAAPESYFSCEPYLKAWADGGRWLPFFAFFVWLQFLYGMIWGAEAVFVSVWTRDRALVYASPLLTSSLLNVIYNLFGGGGIWRIHRHNTAAWLRRAADTGAADGATTLTDAHASAGLFSFDAKEAGAACVKK